jgi:hypothetical protein
VARLRQRGGIEDRTVGAVETVGERGGDGKEDDDPCHDHFRGHAEAEPEDEDWGQHENRKSLQHQNHGPDEAAKTRDGGNREGNENAGRDTGEKPDGHFAKRHHGLSEQKTRLAQQSGGDIGRRGQDIARRRKQPCPCLPQNEQKQDAVQRMGGTHGPDLRRNRTMCEGREVSASSFGLQM